jgi:hypothetical protein
VTSLRFGKKTQAAALLRKSSGNATSLRDDDAAMICFPRLVTLQLWLDWELGFGNWVMGTLELGSDHINLLIDQYMV